MSGGNGGDQFAHHARAVAEQLLGEPNKKLSSQHELRFGNQGSLSVDLKKGTFFDHSEGEGGGVLALIKRETGREGAEAVEWLRENGYYVDDVRGAPGGQAKGGDRGSKQGNSRTDPAGNWLPPAVPDHGTLTKTYDYRAADGTLVYQVCRYDWTDPENPKGHSKTFLQRRPDASKKNGWAYKTQGMTPLPYRLPELVEDIAQGFPVMVVEGEKKVDLLRAIGVPATCNHGGAGKFADDLVPFFAGAEVIILPDNDDPGREHAALVGRRLAPVARDVKILELPGLPPKGGVDDWLPAGGDAEQLYDLVAQAARPFEAAPFISKFQAVEWQDFDKPGPTYDYLIKGVLTAGEMSMLLGESQSGKSFLAIDIAMAVARGTDFFGHRTRRGGVIYQAGESAVGVRRKRFPAYRIGHDVQPGRLPLVLLQGPLDLYSSDDPTDAFIDECLYWGRRMGEVLRLITIDTFNKATPGANENDGKDMGLVLARGDRIRQKTGAHVQFVHHLNAGGSKARGHTSLFANVENVIAVTKLTDSHDAAGRIIREWKVAKQKDGEDGKTTKFVLRSVQIGQDEEGDPVTSCIVARPGQEQEKPVEDEGIVVPHGPNATMLRAIYTAVEKRGVLAPADVGLGAGARAVERKELWAEVRSVFASDDDGEGDAALREGETPDQAKARVKEATKKKVQRARDYLYSRGIIGTKDGWTWLTGKRVKGFPTAPGLSDADRQKADRRIARKAMQDAQEQAATAGPGPNDIPDDLPFDVGDF